MAGGYVRVDKDRVCSLSGIVAIISKKGKDLKRSRIILTKKSYYSRTSLKKLTERIRSGERAKGLFKKTI